MGIKAFKVGQWYRNDIVARNEIFKVLEIQDNDLWILTLDGRKVYMGNIVDHGDYEITEVEACRLKLQLLGSMRHVEVC